MFIVGAFAVGSIALKNKTSEVTPMEDESTVIVAEIDDNLIEPHNAQESDGDMVDDELEEAEEIE